MRLLIAIASLAGALAAGGAAQAQTTPVPVLAPGEVLLETDAVGSATRPASRATLVVTLSARGEDPAAARAALEAEVQRAIAAATTAGVAVQDIQTARPMTRMGFIGNEADSVTLPSDMIGPGMSDQHVSNRILEVLIRNPAEAARIRDAMESAGVRSISQPFYEVADGDAAHAAARADGLRRARANAEAYAAAANMRVVRMLRISDRTTAESLQWTMIMAMSGGRRPAGSGTDVETQEHVSVDFALAPR